MMQIGGRSIGINHRPYIVAEMGANHEGSLDKAMTIVGLAAECRCDAVKVQLFDPTRLAKARGGIDKVVNSGPWRGRALGDLYSQCALHWDWMPDLIDEAEAQGIHLFASVFDLKDLELAKLMDLPAVKISSFDTGNLRLVKAAAEWGRPMIISTPGDEVALGRAIALARQHTPDVAILHCVSAYPAETSKANMRMVGEYLYQYQTPVGFSDHTLNNIAAITGVAYGACIFEKHFDTVDRWMAKDRNTPDAEFSVGPMEMSSYVGDIHAAHAACMYHADTYSELDDLRVHSDLALGVRDEILGGEQ